MSSKVYDRKWRAKNPDKVRAKRERYKARNSEKYLDYFRKRNARVPSLYHGFTYTEILARLKSQGGCCAICKTTEPGKGKARWHGDHDHATGKFRGVLCGRCNLGLGLFLDETARLLAAVEYLQRAR